MKIGIISLYYKNHNYGGLLQAYALTHYLNAHGFDAEQITWDFLDGLKRCPPKISIEDKSAASIIKRYARIIIGKRKLKLYETRLASFKNFEEQIPHSDIVYNYRNILDSVLMYDCFITGSDQVWNMEWYNPENFLAFVPENKKKISYAASMPNIVLSEQQKEVIKKHLDSFQSLSVREKPTSIMLSKVLNRKVEWTLDPTLLLSRDEWEKAARPYNIKQMYILCYFLSGHQPIRNMAKKFAQKVKLPIVTFPDLGGINLTDIVFGKRKVYDAGPDAFLSLIMNAEYVLTDSFHAAVFSNIFKTKYYVFSRDDGKMDSRIISLLELLGAQERFCVEDKYDVSYMISLKDKPLGAESKKFLKMKEYSQQFLIESLLSNNL